MTGISQSSHCIFSASLSFSNDNENLFHHCHCALQLRCFENDRNTHLPKYFIEILSNIFCWFPIWTTFFSYFAKFLPHYKTSVRSAMNSDNTVYCLNKRQLIYILEPQREVIRYNNMTLKFPSLTLTYTINTCINCTKLTSVDNMKAVTSVFSLITYVWTWLMSLALVGLTTVLSC